MATSEFEQAWGFSWRVEKPLLLEVETKSTKTSDVNIEGVLRTIPPGWQGELERQVCGYWTT